MAAQRQIVNSKAFIHGQSRHSQHQRQTVLLAQNESAVGKAEADQREPRSSRDTALGAAVYINPAGMFSNHSSDA
jgi:hypothetical protein